MSANNLYISKKTGNRTSLRMQQNNEISTSDIAYRETYGCKTITQRFRKKNSQKVRVRGRVRVRIRK